MIGHLARACALGIEDARRGNRRRRRGRTGGTGQAHAIYCDAYNRERDRMRRARRLPQLAMALETATTTGQDARCAD